MFSRSIYNKSFVGLLFANMFFWMSTHFFLPVLPLHYHAQGMNDHQVGIAIGAFSVGALLFRIVSGKLADRYGSAPVISAGIVISIVAIISYQYSASLPAATASRVLHGMGISTYAGAAMTMATLMNEEKHTTEILAIYTLFSMVGVGIATSTSAWLYNAGGFVWVVAAGTVATILSLLLSPRNPTLKLKPVAADTLPISAVARNPGVYIPTLSLTAANICFASAMTFLPLLMVSKGVTEFHGFYAAYAVAIVGSRVCVRKLCVALTPERLSYYILLLFAGTMAVVAFSQSSAVLAICGASMGIGYGLAYPAMATTVTASIQPANRGAAFGFYSMAVDVGFGAGAIVMGTVADAWGYGAVFLSVSAYTFGYALIYRFWLWPRINSHFSVCPTL